MTIISSANLLLFSAGLEIASATRMTASSCRMKRRFFFSFCQGVEASIIVCVFFQSRRLGIFTSLCFCLSM